MAEYMRFSETAIVHKIPESLSHEDAVLIEPMACAIHTVARGDIQLDDVVVLAGAGPLGLCMVPVARLKTPKKLIVIDTIEERLALAKAFGADVVINPLKEDADKIVKSLTGGYGCDVYIEATGAPIGVTQGLQMIRKLGRFVEFSVFGQELPLIGPLSATVKNWIFAVLTWHLTVMKLPPISLNVVWLPQKVSSPTVIH